MNLGVITLHNNPVKKLPKVIGRCRKEQDMYILKESVLRDMYASAMSVTKDNLGPEQWRAKNQADFKKEIRERPEREKRDLLKKFF